MEDICRIAVLSIAAALLAACGGSSDNASPGSVVVEVEVQPEPEPDPEPDPEPGPEPGDGQTVATVIPAHLESAITDSGTTADSAFGGKPIYTIDVSALAGGVLDPTGLMLGNDTIFEISGGAARVSPPDGAAPSSGGSLPDCQLEVAPGGVIVGSSSTDFLVINRGCALMADGTADQPILFTAKEEALGTVEDNDRGLWGGLVINGHAPINDCPEGATGGTDDCIKEGEANSGQFGGANSNDHSGVLRYVSVRFAGSNVDPENQLNGIAFQGVGDATLVDYVQVYNNLDDGIEFFGGTVNAKHVVLTGNADDSLDWTDGWTGRIQYLYIEQTDSADNAIEADNREGNEGAMPRSNPTIANMSVYGKSDERALRIRRGTGLALRNSFIDRSERCLRVDGGSRALLGTDLTFEGVSFACAQTHDRDDDGAVKSYLDSAPNVSQNGEKVDPVPLSDTFFDNTDFIGAFGAENWAAGWTYPGSLSHSSQPDFGCPDGTTTSSRMLNGTRVCQLSGTITDDLLLTSNNHYELVGKVVVGGDNEDSADLIVQAGTTIFGGTDVDFLVISRGSKIIANGTRTAPVTLTSQSDLTGAADVAADRGLWGGLVINGNAPINDCPEGAAGGTAGCTKEGEANSGLFGGDDPNDSSGVLNYVVVKFAGANVDPENQLNGIAFQGVGSGTEVDYVQVHNNLDDGVEFFGGTVNAKHMVLTGNADDSLDWTDGWQGSIQYLVIDQPESLSADNGIEADNREGDEAATPRSLPRIANMTINGRSGERAIRLRRGTGLKLYNSVVAGSDNCLRVQGDSLNQLGSGITFDGVSFDCGTVVEGDDVAAIQGLLDRSNLSASGQAVVAADLSGDTFFEAADFIGAVENDDEDWTSGWTVGMPDARVALGCPAGAAEQTETIGGKGVCQLSGTYTSDLALTRSRHYVLDGKVVIGGDNQDSAVLDIESGTTIFGDDPEDFLVISRGSQIRARGTKNAPITLTAEADLMGTGNAGTDRGLWGGLVINGNAPINDCPEGAAGGTAGCAKEGEANSGLFGGDDPNDSSGVLNYVVVKFAGSNVDPENQLNGIAFQGVGSGTVVDYIEVYNNLDDGIEFFGGTVSASHVVLVGNADDSLDWTDGWTGSIQYLHIQQPESLSADNGIEADNREGDETATPISEPWIANMTVAGRSGERAIRLRRGTGLHLYNSMVSGSDNCLRIQGESLNLLGTRIEFSGVGLNCATVNEGDDEMAVQTFLDGSANLVEGAGTPTPVSLPARFDSAGSTIVGSDVSNWGAGWTVGVN